MNSPKSTILPQILNGWKEIANYLGKGVRTVQRYELGLGLPVRRPAGKSRGSVIATTAELDAWVTVSPLRESFALRRGSDDGTALANFKKVLEDHHRLREEMARFRGEMHTAVQELRGNLAGLRARDIDDSRTGSGILVPFENGKRRPN